MSYFRVGRRAATLGPDANTLLLLHMDNNVTDSSPSPKTMTQGSGWYFDSTIKKFGTYSGQSAGSRNMAPAGSWVLCSNTISLSGDFTIDFWWYIGAWWDNTNTYGYPFGFWDGVQMDGYLAVYRPSLLTSDFVLSGPFPSAGAKMPLPAYNSIWPGFMNAWHHWAIVRSSGTLKFYLDGVNAGTPTANTAVIAGQCYVGCYYSQYPYMTPYAPLPYNNYLDEFRISNVARWTANFTPPIAPY